MDKPAAAAAGAAKPDAAAVPAVPAGASAAAALPAQVPLSPCSPLPPADSRRPPRARCRGAETPAAESEELTAAVRVS